METTTTKSVDEDDAEDVATRIKVEFDCHVVDDDRVRIWDVAPDSATYAGGADPEGQWGEDCKGILARVQAACPPGWVAKWSDDDIVIDRATIAEMCAEYDAAAPEREANERAYDDWMRAQRKRRQ